MNSKEKMIETLEKGGEEAEELLRDLGLTGVQSTVLAAAFSIEGPINPEKMAERTSLSGETVRKTLDELARTGLLRTKGSPKVGLTKKGKQLVEDNALI